MHCLWRFKHGATSEKIKHMLKIRYRRCDKTITARCRELEIYGALRLNPACKIKTLVIVWNYENERKGGWRY